MLCISYIGSSASTNWQYSEFFSSPGWKKVIRFLLLNLSLVENQKCLSPTNYQLLLALTFQVNLRSFFHPSWHIGAVYNAQSHVYIVYIKPKVVKRLFDEKYREEYISHHVCGASNEAYIKRVKTAPVKDLKW